MAMTTNSSMSVKPALERGLGGIVRLFVFMRFVLEKRGQLKKAELENAGGPSAPPARLRELKASVKLGERHMVLLLGN
jgi:hypothetical protein